MSRRDRQDFEDIVQQIRNEIEKLQQPEAHHQITENIVKNALKHLYDNTKSAFRRYQDVLSTERTSRKLARRLLEALFLKKNEWGVSRNDADKTRRAIMRQFQLESNMVQNGAPPYDNSLGPTDPRRASQLPIEVLPKHRGTTNQRIPIDDDIGPFTSPSGRPDQDPVRYLDTFQQNHGAFPGESTNAGYYAERNMHESHPPYTSTRGTWQRSSDRPESGIRRSTHSYPQDSGSSWSLEATCDGPNPSRYATHDESDEARGRDFSSNEPHRFGYRPEAPGENASSNFPGFSESYNNEAGFHLRYSHQVPHGKNPPGPVLENGSSSQFNGQPYYTSSYRGRTQ